MSARNHSAKKSIKCKMLPDGSFSFQIACPWGQFPINFAEKAIGMKVAKNQVYEYHSC